MRKGILLSIISAVAVLGMVTMASADSTEWTYFTNAADAGMGPGADLLMGTVDDAADANNALGAYTVATMTWDPANPTCGAPSIGYMTGMEVRCMGNPTGEFTTTYLDVTSTETMPGTGTVKMKLNPAETSGGDNCGTGVYAGSSSTMMIMTGLPPIPTPATPVDGKVFDADTAVPAGDYVCNATTTYSQAYLESVRTKLPTAATYFVVVCATVDFGPNGVPCLNNAVSTSTSIMWTADTIDCGAQCCDNDADGYTGVQCTGGDDCVDTNPLVHPGFIEICGNGLDDDCVGGDEACSGSCAGGPVR